MSNSCPVLTPAERHINDIIERATEGMMAQVFQALEDATKQVSVEWKTAETTENSPPHDYFAAVLHQRMFLLLCGADAETMTGGDPVLAGHLISNQQGIVEHYAWKEEGGMGTR